MSDNKINRKQIVGRETKYLPYKSYRHNDDNVKLRKIRRYSQDEPKSNADQRSTLKVKKLSTRKKPEPVERLMVSAYKGDNTAQRIKSGSLRGILKHSESQTTTDSSLLVNEQLRKDLTHQFQELKFKLDDEITQLKRINEEHRHTNDELQRLNEELRDQYELNSDQIKELLTSDENKTVLLGQVESNILALKQEKDAANARIEELENSNRDLENTNKELMNLVSELHSMMEEKDRVFDHLTRTGKITGHELDQVLRKQEEDLNIRRASDDAKVTLLESNINLLLHTNGELRFKNEQLQESLTELERQLRTPREEETTSSMFDHFDNASINSRAGAVISDSAQVLSSS